MKLYLKRKNRNLGVKNALRIILLISAIKIFAEYFSFASPINNFKFESSIFNFTFDGLFIIVGTIYSGFYLNNIYKFTISIRNKTYNSSDKQEHRFIKECLNFIRFYLIIVPTILLNSIRLNLVYIDKALIEQIKIADIVIGTICLIILVSVFITFIVYKKLLLKEAQHLKELEKLSLNNLKLDLFLLDQLINDIKLSADLFSKKTPVLKESSKEYIQHIDDVFSIFYTDIVVINKKKAMPALVF